MVCGIPDIGLDEIPAPPGGCANGAFIRIDANGDGVVNFLVDALFLLDYLFVLGAPVVECLDAADVTDDGIVNLQDPIWALNYGFVPGGALPPAPFPSCGFDPTDDALECDFACP